MSSNRVQKWERNTKQGIKIKEHDDSHSQEVAVQKEYNKNYAETTVQREHIKNYSKPVSSPKMQTIVNNGQENITYQYQIFEK